MKSLVSLLIGVSLVFAMMFAMPMIANIGSAASAKTLSAPTILTIPTVFDYEASIASNTASSTNVIRLTYAPDSQKLIVALLENGDASGYVISGVTNPVGQFTMQLQDSYNDGEGLFAPVNSVTIEIISLNEDEAQFTVTYSPESESKYVAGRITDPSLSLSGPCTNGSGTGACNQVNTDSDWWRCFRCCLILGCD